MECSVLTVSKLGIENKKVAKTLPELVEAALTGNNDAFGQIVTRYRDQSVRVAVSIVGDIEIARDLSQEAFIKAYRALGTFDRDASFLPWFYRILRNVCLDHLRARGRFRGMLDRFKYRTPVSADLMEEVQQKDVSQKVQQAVALLKPDEREIIRLKHFAGFSYLEISDILQIPKGTVMSRLFYARKSLREILEKTMDLYSRGGQ